ncbi:MAG: hypothetical protein OSB05_08980 [Akkermansiaceae bacterium]|nr:hypothetical protein [Akkermansiaceae bacterium]
MKLPILPSAVMLLIVPLFAHEGHDHTEGVGAIITTATVTGSEGLKYVTAPGWGVPSNGKNIGSLHGDLALDKAGNVYAATNGGPGIVVFDRFGNYTKSLKKGLAGMHSLTTVTEGEQQFIWGSQVQQKRAVKFDLEGNVLATLPNEKTGELEGGMGGLTELLVAPDGHIFFFMGYGSKKIHKLKPDGTLVKTYGGKGTGKDQFTSCHGAAIDLRYDEPRILVCDRDGRRMMHLTMDLTWIGIYGKTPMRRPADVDIQGDYAAVAEIEGRVILMDKEGKVVSSLCDNPNQKQWATNGVPAEQLHDNAFSAPHGIKWGPQGQIYVTEYSQVGRLIALYPKK